MHNMIAKILDRRNDAIQHNTAVPTVREVRLAEAVQLLARDLSPLDPRSQALDELCERVA